MGRSRERAEHSYLRHLAVRGRRLWVSIDYQLYILGKMRPWGEEGGVEQGTYPPSPARSDIEERKISKVTLEENLDAAICCNNIPRCI